MLEEGTSGRAAVPLTLAEPVERLEDRLVIDLVDTGPTVTACLEPACCAPPGRLDEEAAVAQGFHLAGFLSVRRWPRSRFDRCRQVKRTGAVGQQRRALGRRAPQAGAARSAARSRARIRRRSPAATDCSPGPQVTIAR